MREPLKFGDYYLFERVAVGGMAEVFKAISYGVEGFERLFAIKRVLPNISEDQEFIEMFIDEAKIAVQLTHANIGQIFELGNAEGAYFIAMEFVQGKDLRAMFDRARRRGEQLDIAMCCHCIKEVCEALEYAHAKKNERQEPLNLIHRDVSPQNILVSYEGEVKLIDFGIAKAAGKASKTQAGILKGKFGYMSPEQVRGKSIDRRSDLFSLAVVLFELLTLERCFQGESDFSTLEKVRNVDIRRPSSINRDIPPELERIVLKGLSRNPDERYQSAAELQDALQKFLYQSGAFYSRKDLAAMMRRSFDRELRAETQRLAEFRGYAEKVIPEARRASQPKEVKKPEPAKFKAELPALSWEEDEISTAIWDRSPSQVAAMELGLGPVDPPAFAAASGRTPAPQGPVVPASSTPAPSVQPAPPGSQPRFAPAQVAAPHSTHLALPAASVPPRNSDTSTRLMLLVVLFVLALAGGGGYVYYLDQSGPISVRLQTTPVRVSIEVDGRLVHEGDTPFWLQDLEQGPHKLHIQAEGYKPLERTITFGRNDDKRPIVVQLHPEKTGTEVEVKSEPGGAQLFVDGRMVDQTPARAKVKAGRRKLRLEKQGYLPWEGEVDVTADKLNRLDLIRLFPSKVDAVFLPDPTEATITLIFGNGKKMVLGPGNQPRRIENSGKLIVEAELKGYETRRERLRQFHDQRASVVLALKPMANAAPRPRRRSPPKPSPKPGCKGEDCPPKGATARKKPAPRPVAKKPPVAKPKTGKGFLKLLAIPPAKAFIDGRDLGWTPLFKHPLPSGNHTVTLVREKTPEYRQVLTVVIEPGKTTFRRFALQ